MTIALSIALVATLVLTYPRHRRVDKAGGGPSTAPAASQRISEPPATGPAAPALPATSLALPAVHVPTADAAGRVRVPMTDDTPSHLPSPGVPLGWELKEFSGDASVELIRTDGRVALRLRSAGTSFALHRDVVLDVRQFPILAWSWKVVRLPPAGDVRDPARDDQAAQVYAIFPRWPSPATNSDVVGYVWDSHAPVGTTLQHPRAPNVRIIVVESGPARAGAWVREQRNLAEDYRALFGRQPPRLGKVALMIDTNDTRGEAEALFGDLTFARPGVARMEKPVVMLRSAAWPRSDS